MNLQPQGREKEPFGSPPTVHPNASLVCEENKCNVLRTRTRTGAELETSAGDHAQRMVGRGECRRRARGRHARSGDAKATVT